ncbi:solute carrier family 35 member B1 homolog [Drosophila guanche]|uniref:Blast:Solute carrier family 35 member B1 homolog n=1 Tax=Drosophila guanche TaxID=7266 RepID=A0A3B0K2A5_DROGU|nr:solute carrier family 35 member B1 homolog [Drosophila guanche]SPP88397.1 blast:Solute carrier family 35 member B1 homolog [Drosophila guanche]
MNVPERSRFLIYALGIFVCYFLYGIVQEKLTRGRYGEQVQTDGSVGEQFTFALALVWVQCVCNYIFAKVLLAVKPQKEDTTHTGSYAACSLTYLLAMVSTTMAMRWVPYPTAVVGKSAKPIPVMILGVLIGRKSYSWTRYACVLTIVLGVILFMYKEGKVANLPAETTILGEVLLFLSLSMDGLTGAVQERIRAASSPSGQQMMMSMNFWSTLMLGFAMLLTGEVKESLHFALRHPEVWTHLSLLSLCGALGQFFIFLTVANFGPLACSVVTTTRKFFTVLCSVLLFGNILIARQWLGAVLVFAALFVDMLYGKKQSPAAALSSKKPPSDGGRLSEEKKKLIS